MFLSVSLILTNLRAKQGNIGIIQNLKRKQIRTYCRDVIFNQLNTRSDPTDKYWDFKFFKHTEVSKSNGI